MIESLALGQGVLKPHVAERLEKRKGQRVFGLWRYAGSRRLEQNVAATCNIDWHTTGTHAARMFTRGSAMARMTPTWVYAITCEGHTKIGIATDVEARRRGLQGSNPFKVEVYGTRLFEDYSVARRIETALHEEFAEHRGFGEWFTVEPEAVMASLRGWEEYQPEPKPTPPPEAPVKPVPRAKPRHVSASQWRIMKALEF